MGEVWVARNEATGADVALKVLRRGSSESAEERLEERFRQEARLSAMLSHRSIVRVFDLVEEADGTLVLVMELLRGETLHRYLERLGPRPPLEAVALLSPVLGALSHAHELGLVHRDVSPANIFLAVDPDGHVAPKLVDFGIAKRSGAPSPVETVAGDVLGTPRYVAPERIRGATDVDGRADVFSAGVVLYETLTGVSPFAASTASASLAAVLERTVDPDPQIDPRLWLEIRRAMSKQPYERHVTAQELAAALRTALGETDAGLEACLQTTTPRVTSEPEGPEAAASAGQRAGSKRSSKSFPAWLAVAGALCVVLAAAVLALARSPRSEAAPTLPATAAAAVTAQPDSLVPSAAASAVISAAPAAAAPPMAPTVHPRPGVRPRPVATTPGF
jgi:serine/threonine-protein kinase